MQFITSLFSIIWQQDVAESRIPIMLCGNKSDLRSKYESKGQKPVSLKEGEAMAKEHEVSENLNYAWNTIILKTCVMSLKLTLISGHICWDICKRWRQCDWSTCSTCKVIHN